MQKSVETYLKKNNINFEIYEHKPVFTVEESKSIKLKIPAMHTKCLFLKDNSGKYYLVCMNANKKLNISLLRKHLSAKKVHFASPEELYSKLHLTPGSVSLFGMINARDINLIIDREVWDAPSSGFHPNINTSTLVISKDSLRLFCKSLSISPEVLELA